MHDAPVDIAELKATRWMQVRSGKATTEWVYNRRYCVPDTAGFFGYYYLIDKFHATRGSFGLLMVYATAENLDWSSTAAGERFVEVTLKTPDLAVWDSVHVGLRKSALMKMLGPDRWRQDGTSYFKYFGNYDAEFIVIDSVVTQVRVGVYCNREVTP
jgi:hypothetical protein